MTAQIHPRIGLALGGGGVYGFAHIGVLKVLERERIPISLMAATSAGCLVGALWASGMSADKIEGETKRLRLKDFMRLSISRMGVMDGGQMGRTIERLTGFKDVGELPRPLKIVTTDLRTGGKVVLDRGPLGRLVLASSSVPGIFPPVPYGDLLLVDGGVVENVPVLTARESGAELVIGVDLLYHAGEKQRLATALDVLLQSMHLLIIRCSHQMDEAADHVISPEITDVRPNDYEQAHRLIQYGETAAKAALPHLKRKIASARQYPSSALYRVRDRSRLRGRTR